MAYAPLTPPEEMTRDELERALNRSRQVVFEQRQEIEKLQQEVEALRGDGSTELARNVRESERRF